MGEELLHEEKKFYLGTDSPATEFIGDDEYGIMFFASPAASSFPKK
jgi:hypothetical protein